MKLLHFESIIDYVEWLFFVGKGRAKTGFRAILEDFEIKSFRCYTKQIDSILPCVCSLIDHFRVHVAEHSITERGLFSNRTSVTHSANATCATFLFLPYFDVICDLLLNRRTATWNLVVKYERLEDNGALVNGACISRNDFLYGASTFCKWWYKSCSDLYFTFQHG